MPIINNNLTNSVLPTKGRTPNINNSTITATDVYRAGINNQIYNSPEAQVPQYDQLLLNQYTNLQNAGSLDAETLEKINSLANQVGTQEARIAAGASPQILEEYNKTEEKEDKGIIQTIFEVIDAPRNAIANMVKYIVEDRNDSPFTGFMRGLTHEETYSGYDIAEDMGLDGVAKGVVGFTLEIVTDPLTYIPFTGVTNVLKGFGQGATKNLVKNVGKKAYKEGIEAIGMQALEEGVEAGAEAFLNSGLKTVAASAAKEGLQEATKEVSAQAVKQSSRGMSKIINNLWTKTDDIANKLGVQFGPARIQAIADESTRIVNSLTRAIGGASGRRLTLTDDVFQLALSGKYGEEVTAAAMKFSNFKKLAAEAGEDIVLEGTETTIKEALNEAREELLKVLKPYKLDLRIKIFGQNGLNSGDLRNSLAEVYNTGMSGGLATLKQKYGVGTIDELRDTMAEKLGKEITDGDIMLQVAEEAFTPEIMGQIYPSLKKSLAKSADAVPEFKNQLLNALLDDVATSQLTLTEVAKATKYTVRGTTVGIPFTKIEKQLVDGNTMWEIGSRLRTLLGYTITDVDGVAKVVHRGGIAGLADTAMDRTGKILGSLFGRIPILAAGIESGSQLSVTGKLKNVLTSKTVDPAHAWAAKFIKRDTINRTKAGAVAVEHRMSEFFDVLKAANFDNAEDWTKAGELIQTMSESRLLKKGMTDDDIKKVIQGLTELDDKTLADQARALVKTAEDEIIASADSKTLSFVKQQVDGNTFVNTIDKTSDEYKEWANDALEGFTNQLKHRSEIKSAFNSFDEEHQNAIITLARYMNEDIEAIGRELVATGQIPEDLLLSAEYWYVPHKLRMELLLDKGFDYNNRIIGRRTETFNMINASSFKRKYPMGAADVNKILEKKYGIPNMLETNMFYTYMEYAMEQSRLISEGKELYNILDTFGIRIVDPREADALRGAGMNIIVRKNSVQGFLVNNKSIQALENIKNLSPELSKKLTDMQRIDRSLLNLQESIKAKNIIGSSKELDEALKTATNEIKQATSIAKSERKRLIEDVRRVVKTNKNLLDADFEQMFRMAQSDINNFWVKGKYYSATDSLGNIVAKSELGETVYQNKQDGLVPFIGNPDNIESGFRMVKDIPDVMPDGYEVCWLNVKKPFIKSVDNIPEGVDDLTKLLNREELAIYTNNGYDAIQLVDKAGHSAVIPFEDTQVYLKAKQSQQLRAGAVKYADEFVNTINPKTGKIQYVGDFKKTYIPDNTPIAVKDLSKADRDTLAQALREKVGRIQKTVIETEARISRYTDRITYLSRDRIPAQRRYIKSIEAEGVSNSARWFQQQGVLDRLTDELTNIKRYKETALKRLNNIKSYNAYKFMEELEGKSQLLKTTGTSITRSELYQLLGSKADDVLRKLGFDSVLVSELSEPAVYKSLLGTENLVSRKMLKDSYIAMMNKIETSDELRTLYNIITDNGMGEDPLAEAARRVADKQLRDILKRTDGIMRKIINTPGVTTDAVTDIKNLLKSPAVKKLGNAELNLLGKISEADGLFYKLLPNEFETYVSLNNKVQAMVADEGYDIYAIPSGIIDYFNEAITKETNMGVSAIKELMYKFNSIWKPSVTSWRPSFGVRNLISGYFNSWLYAHNTIFDRDVTAIARRLAMKQNLDDIVEIGSFKGTYRELNQQMILNGATNGFIDTDIESIQETIMKNVKGLGESGITNKLKVAAHPLQAIQKFNTGIEDYNRAVLYLACLKNGDSPSFAGEMVRKLQFDYTDLTEAEKIVKRWLPFYTWMRNNVPLQLENFLDNPRLYNMLLRRVPEFTRETVGMSEEEYDNLPEWVKESFPMVLGYDEETGRYTLFDTTLPYQDLSKLGGVESVFGEAVSMLHPLAKIPAELFLNKNLYTGAALESYEGETAEKAIQGTANPVLNSIAKIAPELLRSTPRCYSSN